MSVEPSKNESQTAKPDTRFAPGNPGGPGRTQGSRNTATLILDRMADGEANAIFAQAYGQDPGFFAFYRSMRAYEQSMQHGNTNLVLGPDSNFFRFFGNPSGRPLVQAGPPHPAPGAHSGMSAPPSGRHDDRAAVTDPAK